MIAQPRAYLRIAFLVFVCANAIAAQQPTTEQRLERLEKKVDLILKHLGIPAEAAPALSDNVHVMHGQPACDGTLLPKPNYITCHKNAWKIPLWVTYHLSSENLQGSAERTDDFRPDPDLPAGERSELADYRNSGFDRGHLAPAADFKRSRTAMSETFFLSNMTPQTPNLNRLMWEHLESQVRSLAQAHGRIWIFTGSLFLGENGNPTTPTKDIGTNHVAVPTHFYKVILCNHGSGNYEMFAFLMPNQREPLSGTPRDYIVSVDRIEQLTGLDFFSALPDEQEEKLEKTVATNWPVN